MTHILLVIPPFTQLNTPYPSTAFLTGYLRACGFDVAQADLSIETTLALFSRNSLEQIFSTIQGSEGELPPRVSWALGVADRYIGTIDAVIAFLQGRDQSLAHRICYGGLLPEGPRFDALEDQSWAFGTLGVTDRARHLATLYLEDLADLVKQTVAPCYDLSRYHEPLALSASSFDPIAEALETQPGPIDRLMIQSLETHLEKVRPDVVGFSVPFPGNLFGALRGAQYLRVHLPDTRLVLGGGYVSTELRELRDPRLFDWVDYVVLDGGEAPLKALLEHLAGRLPRTGLCRTFVRSGKEVEFIDCPPGPGSCTTPNAPTIPRSREPDPGPNDTGTPTYDGLILDRYLSVLEVLNPMYRLWSDGRWNKVMAARGCYWRKCTFCDVTLPHIADYRPAEASVVVNRMAALLAETGQSGFHFVDEAAPPSVLKGIALEILERGLCVSWWGNIRFEAFYTPDLCRLLAASGCIAVTGGLEVASDRLLKLINKGVSVSQVARVAAAFTGAGIMVHAYLMYGFPSQTLQELVDSLERVRQLFDAGVVQSGFWHRFYATAHSPVGQTPEAFGIRIVGPASGGFALNDLEHEDLEGCEAARYGPSLDRAVLNFMLGLGLDSDVRTWFDEAVPASRVRPDLIRKTLAMRQDRGELEKWRRLVWLGGAVLRIEQVNGRQGAQRTAAMHVSTAREDVVLKVDHQLSSFWRSLLEENRPGHRDGRPFWSVERAMTEAPQSWERVLTDVTWKKLRELGLLLV